MNPCPNTLGGDRFGRKVPFGAGSWGHSGQLKNYMQGVKLSLQIWPDGRRDGQTWADEIET